jgi:hypothetical protein
MLRPLLFLALLCWNLSLANGYGYKMTSSYCSTSLSIGNIIMDSSAKSCSDTVLVKRSDGSSLQSGASFQPGETLTVTLSNIGNLNSNGYVYEVSGGATFSGGSTGCGSRRSTSSSPSLTMPSSGTVSIWAGYAYGQSTVYITNKVTLSAAIQTQPPSAAPFQSPTLRPTQPTLAPTPAPT